MVMRFCSCAVGVGLLSSDLVSTSLTFQLFSYFYSLHSLFRDLEHYSIILSIFHHRMLDARSLLGSDRPVSRDLAGPLAAGSLTSIDHKRVSTTVKFLEFLNVLSALPILKVVFRDLVDRRVVRSRRSPKT